MFEYREEYKLAMHGCLNITDFCNLNCVYCFCDHKPRYMSLEIAKDAVDYLLNNRKRKLELGFIKPEEKSSITFFGGEPTLLWDEIIVPLTLWATKKYPDLIDWSITTNGTLLNQDRINFLYEHQIYPLLSIDGNKDIQDINRPCRNGESSFDLIEPNIPLLLEKFPYTTFRSTINPNNCKGLFEKTYAFAIEKGFKNIFLCPNDREKWTKENWQDLHNEINKIWVYFTACFLNDEYPPISYHDIDHAFKDIIILDLQTYYQEYNNLTPIRNLSRCGLGTNSISIGYDGKIFSCQEQDSRNTNDYFYIGNIYDGIIETKHSQILIDYSQPKEVCCEDQAECINCPLRNACIEEICPSVSHDIFNNFLTKTKTTCLIRKWCFENGCNTMRLLKEKNNQNFKDYLDEIYKDYKKGGQINV